MTTEGAGAVVVENLEKRFGATPALRGVSFTVERAEIFGFIGPDGAGKTTLFRILTTLMIPDGGQARVLGADVVAGLWALRPRIGYMPGRFSLYPDLTVAENLRFFASVFGTTIERERAQIAPIYSQPLCCALVHRPEILFLDEPTTGVDAVSRREFWDLLGQLKASGITIVVSTPYMDEANRCDRVALIQRGRLLAIDTPEDVARSFDRPLFAIHAGEDGSDVGRPFQGRPAAERYRALLALREWPHTHAVYPFGETLHYADARRDLAPERTIADVAAFLASRGFADARVEQTRPTVEDSFIARMGAPDGDRPVRGDLDGPALSDVDGPAPGGGAEGAA